MWLAPDIAFACAVLGGLVAALARRRATRAGDRVRASRAADLAREAAIVFAMYGVWRQLGEWSFLGTSGARRRGLDLWHVERLLHLPNELTVQRWAMHVPALVRFANLYYIVFHVAPLGVFLVWTYVRHREHHAYWRNQLAFVSLACLAVQYLPVAPPRLYPELGFVDTGARFGPRVYTGGGFDQVGQVAAMPSMHVAWAALIGIAVWQLSTSRRWRWSGPTHAALTVFAVTATAYHWIADSLVAVAILVVGIGAAELAARRRRSLQGTNDVTGRSSRAMQSVG